ncbi:hypothetical protein GCM10017576_03670 [Microbacterium barkeri]|uniref:DUF7882 domain-containing protein n=1 Tax=Microbacterium barkeri TaxID=33917 RepID=A0A9W6LVJ4_9MICO|nr:MULTISPECIES: hypothetical protein [Microbacterium]MDR6876120.1 hypothetical protein [Microbacterium barkeri]WRH17373.1 hypothetical protein GC092_07505 [Microbacterium sp. JZ37]GLJ60238.1 hypothetical protein GCM10017576_03670 [Microbacterium barkeri]
MGVLYYGANASAIHIDDRALAHIKVVIISKLRRDESFSVSWRHPDEREGGRSTIWIHPAIPLRFEFDEADAPTLNREWLEELAVSANALGGIQLVEEHIRTPEKR